MPPAFNLSQDQTLQFKSLNSTEYLTGPPPNSASEDNLTSSLPCEHFQFLARYSRYEYRVRFPIPGNACLAVTMSSISTVLTKTSKYPHLSAVNF